MLKEIVQERLRDCLPKITTLDDQADAVPLLTAH
jgi:hypothetical protein